MTQQVTASTLTRVYNEMKAEAPERLLIFAIGDDLYISFAEDAKTLNDVCGVTLTRTSAKDITAQQAAFPSYELFEHLPKLVRAGKRVAICDEPTKVVEKVEPAKKAARKSAKSESK